MIARADSGCAEPIRAIQAHVRFFGVTAQCITSPAVHGDAVRVQPLLTGHDDKPMRFAEAGWCRFPDFPLVNFNRSGFCWTFSMAFSSRCRSGLGL